MPAYSSNSETLRHVINFDPFRKYYLPWEKHSPCYVESCCPGFPTTSKDNLRDLSLLSKCSHSLCCPGDPIVKEFVLFGTVLAFQDTGRMSFSCQPRTRMTSRSIKYDLRCFKQTSFSSLEVHHTWRFVLRTLPMGIHTLPQMLNLLSLTAPASFLFY